MDFIGLGLVINLLIGALDPATKAMIARFPGLNLVSMDVGWGIAASIAFGTTAAPVVAYFQHIGAEIVTGGQHFAF